MVSMPPAGGAAGLSGKHKDRPPGVRRSRTSPPDQPFQTPARMAQANRPPILIRKGKSIYNRTNPNTLSRCALFNLISSNNVRSGTKIPFKSSLVAPKLPMSSQPKVS